MWIRFAFSFLLYKIKTVISRSIGSKPRFCVTKAKSTRRRGDDATVRGAFGLSVWRRGLHISMCDLTASLNFIYAKLDIFAHIRQILYCKAGKFRGDVSGAEPHLSPENISYGACIGQVRRRTSAAQVQVTHKIFLEVFAAFFDVFKIGRIYRPAYASPHISIPRGILFVGFGKETVRPDGHYILALIFVIKTQL